jgi:pimeloyl-ACP methyl ester carboxylesterase
VTDCDDSEREITVDVRDLTVEVPVWDDEPVTMFARWFAPDAPVPGLPALVCLPGGTYDHNYWDLDVPGSQYSFARELAGRGYHVVALDNVGTGRSTQPARDAGLVDLAAGADGVVAEFRRLLPEGTRVVGLGHSMGGYTLVVQQGTFRTFDAVAVLGSAIGVSCLLPIPDDVIETARSGPEARDALVDAMVETFPARYMIGGREHMMGAFHLADVPEVVTDADLAQTVTYLPRLAAAQSATPWFTAPLAAVIDVPVFLAFGEVDVSPAPHEEPAHFRGSADVTLFLLAGSSHCHNMATTRYALWDRLDLWAGGLTA